MEEFDTLDMNRNEKSDRYPRTQGVATQRGHY